MRNTFLLFGILILLNAAVLNANQTAYSLRTDNPQALYTLGQEAVFTFTASVPGQVKYTLTNDGRDPLGTGSLSYTDAPLHVPAAGLRQPGFLRCEVVFSPGNGDKPVTALAAAAYEPLKIAAGATVPEDFDAFWSERKRELACIPINPRLTPMDTPNEKLESFDVTLDCIGPRVRGYYARPRGASSQSAPAILFVQGAGVSSARRMRVDDFAVEGFIALEINAHGILNNQPKEYYEALSKTTYVKYAYWGRENQYTCYFTGMFTRVVRALEFLKSRPEWNGKVLAVFGSSQGGAQALAAAGLDPDVNIICTGVPAMCDHGGTICGWPRMVPLEADNSYNPQILQASMYNDCVNFARRAKATALFTVGFIDNTCRPTSVYAAYNSYAGLREIINEPLMGHTFPDGHYQRAKSEILKFASQP